METLGDTFKHEIQTKFAKIQPHPYQQDALTMVHIPVLKATKIQYLTDLPQP